MTITALRWQTMTRAVNEMKSPNSFLTNLLFSNHVTLPTETIEIDILRGDRRMAPFVHVNSEAVAVSGYDQSFQQVKAPNIRIKRPLTPSQLLFDRQAGSNIFVTDTTADVNAHIARDLGRMSDYVTNSIEWLVSSAIRGVIEYNAALDPTENEVFRITFPRPATNTRVLTGNDRWTTSSTVMTLGSNARLEEDTNTVKKRMVEEHGLVPTDCVLGSIAAKALRNMLRVDTGLERLMKTDSNIKVGSVDLTQNYSEQGVIFIGTLFGIRWWEYDRQIIGPDGVTLVDFIRPTYAEFMAVTPAAENILYFGAIPDMEAFEGGLLQSERFSKSWIQKDPSVYWALLHSRPLPVTRRPGAFYSLAVFS